MEDYEFPSIECFLYYRYVESYDEVKVVKDAPFLNTEDIRIDSVLPRHDWQVTLIRNEMGYARQLYDKPLSKQELTGILKVNVELYILGEMYDLPKLKKLATEKILGAEQFFVKSQFDLVLKALWENTGEDDYQLRFQVYRRCTLNHKVIEQYPAFASTIKRLVGSAVWDVTKLHLEEASSKQEQVKSTAEKQAEAKIQGSKDTVAQMKAKVSAHQETLNSYKQHNAELLNRNIQLRGDLMDIKAEWQRIAQISCSKCGKSVANTKWTEERDEKGRLLWLCTCNAKSAALR